MPAKKESKTPRTTTGRMIDKGQAEYSITDNLESKEGQLMLGPTRVIIMTETAYSFLLRVIHEQAPHIVKYAFYDMGYRAGQQLMESMAQRIQDPEKAFQYFVETYKQTGYGNLEVSSFDLSEPRATLSGTNLFESLMAKQASIYRSPRTVDHYSRGMFAGFMSILLGKEVVCEEMACEFRGDAACEFVIAPFEV